MISSFQAFPRFRLWTVSVQICCLSTAMLFTGCESKPVLPDLGTVKGTVTLNGQPLAQATVGFESSEDGSICMGATDKAGRYELFTQRANAAPGAAVGEHRVRIEKPLISKDGATEMLPSRYNSSTDLTADVKPGENEINFDLTSP